MKSTQFTFWGSLTVAVGIGLLMQSFSAWNEAQLWHELSSLLWLVMGLTSIMAGWVLLQAPPWRRLPVLAWVTCMLIGTHIVFALRLVRTQADTAVESIVCTMLREPCPEMVISNPDVWMELAATNAFSLYPILILYVYNRRTTRVATEPPN